MSDQTDEQNIKTVFQQYASTNLPSFLNDFFLRSKAVINAIKAGKADEIYQFDDEHRYIVNIMSNGLITPKYVFNNGSESIKYYAFKNDLTLRPMGVADPIWYFAFANNVLIAHDSWMIDMYADSDDFPSVARHSDSPILSRKMDTLTAIDYETHENSNFYIFSGFSNELTTKSKTVFQYNQIRNIRDEGAHPFYMKIDVESYYRNIYTHQLAQLADLLPFNQLKADETNLFLDFLDRYNMRVSDNQTKGILQGPYSSQVSAELLGIAIDASIDQMLRKHDELRHVTFKRFVDDFTFYADDEGALSLVLVQVDRIFRSYGLSRKVEKTKIGRGFPPQKGGNLDDLIFSKKKGNLFSNNSRFLTMTNVVSLRRRLGELIDLNNVSQIRTILTLLRKNVIPEKSSATSNSVIQSFCRVVLKTAISFPVVSVHAYKLFEAILQNVGRTRSQAIVLDILTGTSDFIDSNYPETEMQIWHYYLLGKYLPSKKRNSVLSHLLSQIDSDSLWSDDVLLVCSFVKKDFKQNKRIWNAAKSQYLRQSKLRPESKPVGIEHSKWVPLIFSLYQYVRNMDTRNAEAERVVFRKEILGYFFTKKGQVAIQKLGLLTFL